MRWRGGFRPALAAFGVNPRQHRRHGVQRRGGDGAVQIKGGQHSGQRLVFPHAHAVGEGEVENLLGHGPAPLGGERGLSVRLAFHGNGGARQVIMTIGRVLHGRINGEHA